MNRTIKRLAKRKTKASTNKISFGGHSARSIILKCGIKCWPHPFLPRIFSPLLSQTSRSHARNKGPTIPLALTPLQNAYLMVVVWALTWTHGEPRFCRHSSLMEIFSLVLCHGRVCHIAAAICTQICQSSSANMQLVYLWRFIHRAACEPWVGDVRGWACFSGISHLYLQQCFQPRFSRTWNRVSKASQPELKKTWKTHCSVAIKNWWTYTFSLSFYLLLK